MATERLGIGGMAAEMKDFYSRILLSVAESNLVFQNYGLKQNIPPRSGKTIEWRRFEKLLVGTHTLTEGTPPAAVQATISTVTATISQFGAYARLSDVLNLQAYDPIVDEYANKFGIHMAEVLDTVVRDAIVAGITSIQYAADATSLATVGSGDYLNAAEINEAKNTLARNMAKPIAGRYICFVHPDNVKDLYDDPKILNAFQYALARSEVNPLFTGVLGDWMGVRFVETTQVQIQASLGLSGADVYEVIMVGEECYGVTGLDAQQAKVYIQQPGGISDPLEQASTVGWKAAVAARVLNPAWGVRIRCASSRKPAA